MSLRSDIEALLADEVAPKRVSTLAKKIEDLFEVEEPTAEIALQVLQEALGAKPKRGRPKGTAKPRAAKAAKAPKAAKAAKATKVARSGKRKMKDDTHGSMSESKGLYWALYRKAWHEFESSKSEPNSAILAKCTPEDGDAARIKAASREKVAIVLDQVRNRLIDQGKIDGAKSAKATKAAKPVKEAPVEAVVAEAPSAPAPVVPIHASASNGAAAGDGLTEAQRQALNL